MAFGDNQRRGSFGPKPVEEGNEYDVEIEGIGTKGDGIGRIKGFVVIVPNTKVGDKVKVKISAVRGKVAFGDVVGAAETAPAEEKAEEAEEGKEEEATEEAAEEEEEAEPEAEADEEKKEEAPAEEAEPAAEETEEPKEEAPAEEEAEDAPEADEEKKE